MSSHFGDAPARSTARADTMASGPPERREPLTAPAPVAGAVGLIRDTVRLWLAVILCGIMFSGWCAIAFLISPFLSPVRRLRIGRSGMQRLFCGYLRLLDAAGLVHVDAGELDALKGERSLILAPNHPSMMDVVLIISRLDNVCCIMKAELWTNIFLGAGSRMAGFIRNDSPRSMIRLATDDLAAGGQLLIFPEATRTVRLPVNPLSRGFALISKKAGVPVQTILIETDSPYLSKGWPLFRRPPFPIRFRLRLGRRFEPADDVDDLVDAVERHYREQLT